MLANGDVVEYKPYRARTRYTLIESWVYKKVEDAFLSISLLPLSALYYKRGVKEGRSPSYKNSPPLL